MERNGKSKAFIILIFFIMIGVSFTQVSLSKNLFSMDKQGESAFNGQILFSPYHGTTTYLIDNTSTINHTWASTYRPFTESYLLDDGAIMRPILFHSGVQKILWNGTIAWDYRYNVDDCTCHHDIECLPNGNVLMIVWVTKTRAQAIAAGRNPNTIQGATFTPDKIIEVKQTGPTSGDIVWEWHVWDHLIQDYDPSKDNYGVVGDHPELIDINYGDYFTYDWLHTNSVDYHPEFDQILIDVHNFNEVWVIDHSTTTEEAAGHSGGKYGKGGDLLYRWGNPEAYDAGTESDQKLFFQHDASWIKPGYSGEGNILVFNNGNNRPSGQYSTVDEFTPPVDSNGEYYLESGSAYGPEDYTWSYTADPPTSFYSNVYGGAQRLENGNTLICYGTKGVFFEVNPDQTTVWQWTNPYPNPTENAVFKIEYIPSNIPPYEPSNPIPLDGSENWTGDCLCWTSGDPDGDEVLYDVYFGNCSPPPLFCTDQSENCTDLPGGWFDYNTTYYWKVVAWDEHGASTLGPIWSFTTEPNYPPDPAHDPIPHDGACNVPGDAILCWNGSDPNERDELKYDVYFGIIYPPKIVEHNQTETCYDPYGTADMPLFEEYYWRIVTWDSKGEFNPSPIWNFKTGIPIPPTDPEIDGPNRGIPGIDYNFTFVSTNSNNLSIKYYVDWGDGNTMESDYNASGDVVTLNHTWNARKTYNIKAIAESIYGQQSNKSQHSINIPRNKSFNFNIDLLSWLYDRFPLLERLLDLIKVMKISNFKN